MPGVHPPRRLRRYTFPENALIALSCLVAAGVWAAPAPLAKPARTGPKLDGTVADLARRGYDVRTLERVGSDLWEMRCEGILVPYRVRASHRAAALRAFWKGDGELALDRIPDGIQ